MKGRNKKEQRLGPPVGDKIPVAFGSVDCFVICLIYCLQTFVPSSQMLLICPLVVPFSVYLSCRSGGELFIKLKRSSLRTQKKRSPYIRGRKKRGLGIGGEKIGHTSGEKKGAHTSGEKGPDIRGEKEA